MALHLLVDDFYFSATFDHEADEELALNPVSDVKYAEELQFQEALMSNVVSTQMMKNNGASSSELVIHSSLRPNVEEIETVMIELGDPSYSFCEICAERKVFDDMFVNKNCAHVFCFECITKHVAIKLQESVRAVTCPGLNCDGVIEIEGCKERIPKEVFDRWNEVQCEAIFVGFRKFYCPFKDCSAMLLNEDDDGGEVIREAECPICHRLFCAQCNVAWHSGVQCEVLMKMSEDERGREDLMVRELARSQKWGRCPRCKFYVERTDGCPHMTCRCSFQFCYGCEAEWTANHGGCQRN